jgi:hypothetical protein
MSIKDFFNMKSSDSNDNLELELPEVQKTEPVLESVEIKPEISIDPNIELMNIREKYENEMNSFKLNYIKSVVAEVEEPVKSEFKAKYGVESNIFISNKLEVKRISDNHYGVFAKEDILRGEILEVAKFISTDIPFPNLTKSLKSVVYMFPKDSKSNNCVVVYGFGSLYNSALKTEEKNVDWITDIETKLFIYFTVDDVKKGNELVIYYNNHEF